MSDFSWFSDTQWARIEPLLPTDVLGMKRVDDRRILSGIVHALRCGGRWADCADVYGPKKTLYNRFVRWSERGLPPQGLAAHRHPFDRNIKSFMGAIALAAAAIWWLQ